MTGALPAYMLHIAVCALLFLVLAGRPMFDAPPGDWYNRVNDTNPRTEILEFFMNNPLDPTYLITPAVFGPLEWAFFILQVAGVAAGIYLAFLRKDNNRVRRGLLQKLGYALMALGGVGVLLGLLRLNQVAVFNQRYWFLLAGIADVILAGYVAYYSRAVYPRQLAQSHTSRGKASRQAPARVPAASSSSSSSSASSSAGTNGHESSQEPEPVTRGGRREARQRRKRKRH
jgi:hypothetical protein